MSLNELSLWKDCFKIFWYSVTCRACIGQHFGMQQMKVVLAQVLRNYEFYRDAETEEPDIAPGVTLQSKNGVQLKLKRVQQDAGLWEFQWKNLFPETNCFSCANAKWLHDQTEEMHQLFAHLYTFSNLAIACFWLQFEMNLSKHESIHMPWV